MITFSLLVFVFALCSANVVDVDPTLQVPETSPDSCSVKFRNPLDEKSLQAYFTSNLFHVIWADALGEYRKGKDNTCILLSVPPEAFDVIMQYVSPDLIALINKALYAAIKRLIVLRWENIVKFSLGEKWFSDRHSVTCLLQRFASELEIVEYSAKAIQNAIVRTISGISHFANVVPSCLCEFLIAVRKGLPKLEDCNVLKQLPIELVAGTAVRIALGLHEAVLPAEDRRKLLLYLARLYGSPQIFAIMNGLNPHAPIGKIMRLYKDFTEYDHGKVFAEALLYVINEDPELYAAKHIYENQCDAYKDCGYDLAPIFNPQFVTRHEFSEALIKEVVEGLRRETRVSMLLRILAEYISRYATVPTRLIEAIRASDQEPTLFEATWLHIIAPSFFECRENAKIGIEVCTYIVLGSVFGRKLPPGILISERASFLEGSIIYDAAPLLLINDLSRGEFLYRLFPIFEKANTEVFEDGQFDFFAILQNKDKLLFAQCLISNTGPKYLDRCNEHNLPIRETLSAILEYVGSDVERALEFKDYLALFLGVYLLTPHRELAHEILAHLPKKIVIPDFLLPSDLRTGVLERVSRRIQLYMNPTSGSL